MFTAINHGIVDGDRKLQGLKIPGASIPAIANFNKYFGLPNSEYPQDTDTLDDIDTYIENVNRMSSMVGSKITYLQEKFNALEAEKIAISYSKSHFKDIDIAEESTAFAREQLRQQTAGAMYSQANAQAQFALSLLP